MNIQDLPTLVKHFNDFKKKNIPALYHVTTESNAKDILKNGLNTSFMGKNHGSMEIQPQKQLVFLSRHPNSNNLNSSIYESGDKLVSLEINPEILILDDIYPDDGMFAAIGQEELFETIEEIKELLDIPYDEAEIIYNATFELTSDNVEEWKIFSLWYLFKEGEISTPHSIPKEYIKYSHNVDFEFIN